MKKISQFKRKNSLSKTIRMRLIPMGKTEDNLNKKLLLEADEERAENYKKVKGYIDEYHRAFISDAISMVEIEGLDEYADLYYNVSKDADVAKRMEELEKEFRKQIVKGFTTDERYAKLFKADMIKDLLPSYFDKEEEQHIIAQFNDFTTYFSSFSTIRQNMYSVEPKAGAIAHRCVSDNLPKFLDNCRVFGKIKDVLLDKLQIVDNDYKEILPISLVGMFEARAFNLVLTQEGISAYNAVIGGINMYINLHNQNADRPRRLPLLKSLYKQILSESNSISFIPESFKEDQEVLNGIQDFYKSIQDALCEIEKLFGEFAVYDLGGIYVRNDSSVTTISKQVFGSWSVVVDGWNKSYDENSGVKNKETEKYLDTRRKAYKAHKSFSLEEIQNYGFDINPEVTSLSDYFKESIQVNCRDIKEAYGEAANLLSEPYDKEKKLSKDEKSVEKLKVLLDAIKALEATMKMLLGTGKEANKDEAFYGAYLSLYGQIAMVDLLYDKVRNYVTKRPYSKDKIKLNFENPQLLGGWDKNKERDYRTVMLRMDEDYYLAIMDKSNNKVFMDSPYIEGEECYEKMEYKLLPGPNKMLPKVFFAKSNEEIFTPSPEINDIRKKETFKKGNNFILEDCHKMIDFYKSSIDKHEDWRKFDFVFKDTKDYKDIGEFYSDVKEQGYSVSFKKVSKAYIDEMVDNGALYLFRIYNKDFSKCSKGTPNLHTMYFRMLFDDRNLKNVVYQLNGGAEMFYRKASLKKDKPEHPAGKPIDNKNPDNPKKQSVFRFDLYKDKRFMENQYFLHLPITMNFKADNVYNINYEVRRAIKECDSNYVIGIDRGERHLLYISVVDDQGRIVEEGQFSMNKIVNTYNGVKLETDYHKLLDAKENGRLKARQDWTTIENIKELKSGYLSQVVHKICELVVKYDAIVAMEDLSAGFKNSRKKVEKEVYQKFEKMLTDKLAYLVDKKAQADEDGGLLNAYQLTNKPGNLDKPKQDGFIMYVPAWLTSNIDPVTGFANLFRLKSGMSAADIKEFVSSFETIAYNEKEDLFEFTFDYDKFAGGSVSYRKKWTVCTYGERLEKYINPDINNKWDERTVILTDELKGLFSQYNILLDAHIRESVLENGDKQLLSQLLRFFRLTVQMRNSKTSDGEMDYIISPVKDAYGRFYDSRDYKNGDETLALPENADANGAYNIARKALYAVDVIKATDVNELDRAMIYPSNKDWLWYVQK